MCHLGGAFQSKQAPAQHCVVINRRISLPEEAANRLEHSNCHLTLCWVCFSSVTAQAHLNQMIISSQHPSRFCRRLLINHFYTYQVFGWRVKSKTVGKMDLSIELKSPAVGNSQGEKLLKVNSWIVGSTSSYFTFWWFNKENIIVDIRGTDPPFSTYAADRNVWRSLSPALLSSTMSSTIWRAEISSLDFDYSTYEHLSHSRLVHESRVNDALICLAVFALWSEAQLYLFKLPLLFLLQLQLFPHL